MPEFKWTNERAKAAVLLAEDKLTDEQIAAKIGVTKTTIENWKHVPEFAAKISQHVEKFRDAILTTGIADKVNRIARLDRDWKRLQQVIEDRAANSPVDMLGGSTGTVVRSEKPSKFGTVIEDRVDTGTLAELRNMEKQAAQELGQWVEKQELSGQVGMPLVMDEIGSLTPEEIKQRTERARLLLSAGRVPDAS